MQPTNVTKIATRPGRLRQFHTRSRTGCVTCKQRHVRCDETTPICNNCRLNKRVCKYESDKAPLRELRAFERGPRHPGEQEPWLCTDRVELMPFNLTMASPWQGGLGAEVDPFDSMLVGMRYRTKDLLSYFCQMNGFISIEKQEGSVRTVLGDAVIFRNTLLVAGLHYAWNTGKLNFFESTFLYHKIEAMRMVNFRLSYLQTETIEICIRQIAMLFFVEYCLNHQEAAEAHLRALVSLIGYKAKRPKNKNLFQNIYIILLYFFQLSFNMETTGLFASYRPSHMLDSSNGGAECQGYQPLPRPLSALEELKSIKDEDAMPIINNLIQISKGDQWYIQMLRQGAIMTALDNSIAGGSKRPVMAPLVSIGSKSALVFSTILKQSSGVPHEVRFYLAILSSLRRDLSNETQHLYQSENSITSERDFFFWRAFIGALSIYKAQTIYSDRVDEARTRLLEELQFSFDGFIKLWSELMGGMIDWTIAQETLARTAWPEDQVDREEVGVIWSRAMSWPNAVSTDR